MAVIVKQDVVNFASELDQVTSGPVLTEEAWDDILLSANKIDLDDDQDTRMARIFWSAHVATMVRRGRSASAGPVTAESSGTVRRSYGLVQASSGAGSNAETRYGKLYSDMLNSSNVAGPFVI